MIDARWNFKQRIQYAYFKVSNVSMAEKARWIRLIPSIMMWTQKTHRKINYSLAELFMGGPV